jgi:multisubunit Na+/H+ antiporter MnhC subunit
MSRKRKKAPTTRQLIKQHAVQNATNLPFALITALVVAFAIKAVGANKNAQ